MPYALPQDMIDRFGEREMTQLSAPSSTVDTRRIAGALDDASAEIDAYLQGRYELPLTHIPAVLPRLACDIARYRLWDDRASEEVRDRYKDAVRMLEMIAKGVIDLGQPGPGSGLAVVTAREDVPRPNPWRGL